MCPLPRDAASPVANREPHHSCAHIEAARRPIFENHPDLILDGELYSDALRDELAPIISIINTRRLDAASHARCAELIGFHAFDLRSHAGPFSAGRGALAALIAFGLHRLSPLVMVETTRVHGQAQLDELFASYRAAGYERQMIR